MGVEAQFIFAEGGGDDAGGGFRVGKQNEVGCELTGGILGGWGIGEGVGGGRGVCGAEGHRECGKALTQFAKGGAEHEAGDGRTGGDVQVVFGLAGPAPKPGSRAIHLFQDLLGLCQEDTAGGGEVQPSRFTNYEPAAEVVFQGFEAVADGGGGLSEFRGGEPHVEGAGEHDEDLKLMAVEGVGHGWETAPAAGMMTWVVRGERTAG